jgi:hypothetical protein
MNRISVDSALLDALIDAGIANAQELQDICDEAETCAAESSDADTVPAPFAALELISDWEIAYKALQDDLERRAS